MITLVGWCAGGKGGGVSVNSMGEMGKDFCANFLQNFRGNIDRRSWRELFQYFMTLSFGGGSHLGVPCMCAHLGRVEQEGGKTS